MSKGLNKKNHNSKGLTLLELVIVMVILAIIAGVFYGKSLNRGTSTARANAMAGILENTIEAIGQFFGANGCLTTALNCGGLFTDTSTDNAPQLVNLNFLSSEKTPYDPNDGIDIFLAGTASPADRVIHIVFKGIDTPEEATQIYNNLVSNFDQMKNIAFCNPNGGTEVHVFFVPPTLTTVPKSTLLTLCP